MIFNSLVKVDSETVALAHGPSNSSPNSITTFTISSDGTTITEVATLEHDTTRMSGPSLVQVDSDTYALAYSGEDIDGFISTFTIGTSIPHKVGTISPTSSGVLSWTAPTAGASAITDYIIQYSIDDSNWTTFDDGTSTITTATVTGLTDGTTYYFRVAAVNSSGTGDFSSSSSVRFLSTIGGGNGSCDFNAFGPNKSLRVSQVSYDIETFELLAHVSSSCGSVTSKVITPDKIGTLGLSMNQPLLDENIAVYTTYLEESDKKFRIAFENDRNSFDETFYIHDKSIMKKYTGLTGYTSEQQGTIYQPPEPIVEATPEPEQLPETDTSMWYWFVIAGILGIIFLVLYNSRQKKCRECGAKLTQSEIDNDQKTCNKCKFDSN